jgi:exodeoxyribonuclease V alpha subunit
VSLPLNLRTPGLLQAAQSALDAGVLAPTPLQIIDTVAARYAVADPDVLFGLALVLEAQDRGHTALDLAVVDRALPPPEHSDAPAPTWPDESARGDWAARVSACALVGDAAAADRPFEVLVDGARTLLMSRRMADEQRRLAAAVRRLALAQPDPAFEPEEVEDALQRLLPDALDGEAAQAVRLAASGALTVVTGGPGTGKTWSIKRLLAVLLGKRLDLRIVLAAPTGKAAVRMTEAMGEKLAELGLDDAVRERLATLPASTVHKLLKIRPDSGATRYGPDAPLPAEVVVVDEASMLDVTLMRKLVEAMGDGTRLILLGDKDQLASVDAGTVLADLVADAVAGSTEGLAGRVAFFTVNHRSKNAPTVAAAASAIQTATKDSLARAVSLLVGERTADDETDPDRLRQLKPIPLRGRPTPELLDQLAAPYLVGGDSPGYAEAIAVRLRSGGIGALWADAVGLLKALERYRVLATHRRGSLGVSGLNRALAQRVQRHLAWAMAGEGPPPKEASTDEMKPVPRRAGLWLGQPVLITENAYDVDLRNGDVGLVLHRPGKGLEVVFPVSTGGVATARSLPISRLPGHSSALAMTVHKSQGSQFHEVGLVLAGRPSPIQTRELIYTGLTRAQSRVRWAGTKEELEDALSRPVGRISALGVLLRD